MQVNMIKEQFRALPFDEKSFPVGSFFTWKDCTLSYIVLHWNPLCAEILSLERDMVEIFDIDPRKIYYRLEPISINLKKI